MAIPDIFLDKSWSILFIPPGSRVDILHDLLLQPIDCPAVSQRLQHLTSDFQKFLSSQVPAYKDELDDEAERTGQLGECIVDRILLSNMETSLGLSIQARYQKTTYTVLLLARQELGDAGTMMCKASQNHVARVKRWLESGLGLQHQAMSLQLPPPLLLRMCSDFLAELDKSLAGSSESSALRQATLKQVIGNLKLVVTFSNATGAEIAPHLKTMELDVPSETVGVLLAKAKERENSEVLPEYGFLDELKKALHEKTGLVLPLTGQGIDKKASTVDQGNGLDSLRSDPEPPLKVSKVRCAAFALSTDGKLKLASKPLRDADVIGYDECQLRLGYFGLIQAVCKEAEMRSQEDN